jgi:hypothetical protein
LIVSVGVRIPVLAVQDTIWIVEVHGSKKRRGKESIGWIVGGGELE